MKNYYIDYRDLDEVLDTETPINLIIELTSETDEDFTNFMVDFHEDKLKHNIDSLIIEFYYTKEIIEYLIDLDGSFLLSCIDEETHLEELSKLDLKNFVSYNTIKTPKDAYKYYAVGFNRLKVGSPLINNQMELESVAKDFELFYIPNEVSFAIGSYLDADWIRPDAVSLYEDVDNMIIRSSDSVNINTALKAYRAGGYLGMIRDIVVGFDSEENKYRNAMNVNFSAAFDYNKTVCDGDCRRCASCQRTLDLSLEFSEISEMLEIKD